LHVLPVRGARRLHVGTWGSGGSEEERVMSATGRSDVRRVDDAYMTPAWCVRAIWPKLQSYGSCLDPCAGEGGILKTLQGRWKYPTYYGIEIDAMRAHTCDIVNKVPCTIADALMYSWTDACIGLPAELIITNPPYTLAMEFLQKALVSGSKQVCFLLRLNFLGSQGRAAFWKTHPCDVYVLPKRPSFTGKGTDATEYAWFHFDLTRRSGCARGIGHWEILDV